MVHGTEVHERHILIPIGKRAVIIDGAIRIDRTPRFHQIMDSLSVMKHDHSARTKFQGVHGAILVTPLAKPVIKNSLAIGLEE